MSEEARGKLSLQQWLAIIALLVSILGLLFGSGVIANIWEGDEERAQQAQSKINAHLVPIQGLLQENEELYTDLTGPDYAEPGWGIQESYYEKVRREGAEPHRIMRSKIDQLVANNGKILAHLQTYGQIVTPALREQAELFRRHAVRYSTRWREMTQAALEGSPIPIAEPVFPREFPAAVEAEIQEVRRQAS